MGDKVSNLLCLVEFLEWLVGLFIFFRVYLGDKDEVVDCGCVNKDVFIREFKD